MIQDLHSHTYYSFCGGDKPETIIEAAIAGGIEMLGITDHQYGIGFGKFDVFAREGDAIDVDYGRTLERYFDHINLLREKYADRIKILRGVEVNTLSPSNLVLPKKADISFFDYCLIENLHRPDESIAHGDLFSFAKRCGCVTGIAHTDMFAFIQKIGADPLEYFSRMAEENIFWEMNVNLDTIHGGHEHEYMLEFFKNPEQQDIIRRSKVKLSIGFDGHRIADYKPERIAHYCALLEEFNIPMAFADK